MQKASMAMAAGILNIVTGVCAFLGLLCTLSWLFFLRSIASYDAYASPFYYGLPDVYGVYRYFGIIAIIISGYLLLQAIMGIIGGIYALRRKRWGVALAGSIIALLPFNPLGLASLILVTTAKDEFE